MTDLSELTPDQAHELPAYPTWTPGDPGSTICHAAPVGNGVVIRQGQLVELDPDCDNFAVRVAMTGSSLVVGVADRDVEPYGLCRVHHSGVQALRTVADLACGQRVQAGDDGCVEPLAHGRCIGLTMASARAGHTAHILLTLS